MTTGATFSTDRKYRYVLWRDWDLSKPVVVFIMLNPSTADELENDPTVERCERRAKKMGYGGLVVLNLFAFRATDPKELYSCLDPIGIQNDEAIANQVMKAHKEGGIIICGWGTHGKLFSRGQKVLARFSLIFGIKPYYLELNKDGTPKHPLYISYNIKPKVWLK
jgi:hypothetical protein